MRGYRRAARWPRRTGWEFSRAALREPTRGELEFERKRRVERVIVQLARRLPAKKTGVRIGKFTNDLSASRILL